MKTQKDLGIWMDHSMACLLDAKSDPMTTKTISSSFTHHEKHRIANKGEGHMHNDEQQKQHAYYKEIGEAIRNYDRVVLFGPTKAKEELFNLLKKDHSFEKIKIEVKHSDKMTENQQHAFVKQYFLHVLS